MLYARKRARAREGERERERERERRIAAKCMAKEREVFSKRTKNEKVACRKEIEY